MLLIKLRKIRTVLLFFIVLISRMYRRRSRNVPGGVVPLEKPKARLGRPRVTDKIPGLRDWILDYLNMGCSAADRQRQTGTLHSLRTIPEMQEHIRGRVEAYNEAFNCNHSWLVYSLFISVLLIFFILLLATIYVSRKYVWTPFEL